MKLIKCALFTLLIALVPSGQAHAASYQDFSGKNIQVLVQFRSAGLVRQGTYQQTQTMDQTQMLLVSDGLEGRLFIGKQLPNVIWYRDYLAREGYLTAQVVFREIGSQLIVKPRIVGDQIEITLTPEVSYEANDGSGAVAVKKLSTTVHVANGQSIEIGSGINRSEFDNNFYKLQSGEAIQIILTPTIQS